MFQNQGFPPLPAVLGAQGQMLAQQLGSLAQAQAFPQQPQIAPIPQVVLQPIQLPSQNISVGSNTQTNAGADTTFVFAQPVPAAQWLIPHGLLSFPSVTTVDATGQVILGEVQYRSNLLVFVNFSQPVAGNAYLNV